MNYFEQLRLGRWMPCTMPLTPKTKNGRMLCGDGTMGPQVRGIAEINIGHNTLDLNALQAVYSPNGKFRNT